MLGLHHEQQHQELLLTDIKHVFSVNPLRPAYAAPRDRRSTCDSHFCSRLAAVSGRYLAWIGHAGEGFAFDNEGPRRRVFVEPSVLATRLVTAGEYLALSKMGATRGLSCGFRRDGQPCRRRDGERLCTGNRWTAIGGS